MNMLFILQIFIVFIMIHHFTLLQHTKYTSYYWIERSLILGILSNFLVTFHLYTSSIFKYIDMNDFFYICIFSTIAPVFLFTIYFEFYKKYSSIYKNGYEKIIHRNKFSY